MRLFNLTNPVTLTVAVVMLLMPFRVSAQSDGGFDELAELALSELLSLEVTSVTKSSQRLGESAAAIHVITAADIRAHGYLSIAQALRSVPGMNVAQITPYESAISSRGFQGLWSNKLLVLVDGRSVYSPLFGGVYWDLQQMPMQDVERIEVIRGPGGALWGANAVNGVINVITRSSRDTIGTLASIRANGDEKTLSARHGMDLSENVSARLFARHQKIEDGYNAQGAATRDGIESAQLGFRLDAELEDNGQFTLSGGYFRGENRRTIPEVSLVDFSVIPRPATDEPRAVYVTGRWSRELADGGALELRAFYDDYERDLSTLRESTRTVDVEFQHVWPAGRQLELVWGAGFRSIENETEDTVVLSFNPRSREDEVANAFLQGQWRSLDGGISLTVGSKFEHNDYTGLEVQPTLRGLWAMSTHTQMWAALSRAKRTPARFDSDVSIQFYTAGFPIPNRLTISGGGDALDAERVDTMELGIRHALDAADLQIDLALFYSEYEDIVDYQYGLPLCFPSATLPPCFVPTDQFLSLAAQFGNLTRARTHGGELTIDWVPSHTTHLRAAVSYVDLDLSDGAVNSVDSPDTQVLLELTRSLSARSKLALSVRHIGQISDLDIDSYTTADIRWSLALSPNLELALVARNLFEDGRVEYFDPVLSSSASLVEEQFSAELLFRL